jgi:uncharacterized protein YwgA
MWSNRSNWALALIDTANYVEGLTRLHKYAFLASKKIRGISKLGFYEDWQASDYGPFSKDLARDICVLTDKELIKHEEKPNKYGYKVDFISATEQGSKVIKEFEERFKKYINELHKIIEIYQSKRLLDLLHDVYYLYPQYAVQSKILAKVGKEIYESDSYLNPQYDNSSE